MTLASVPCKYQTRDGVVPHRVCASEGRPLPANQLVASSRAGASCEVQAETQPKAAGSGTLSGQSFLQS